LQQEWKTPPLWGVRDSGPYLHDGRAATLEEAIAWHGGEAYTSANRFARLPARQQAELASFLRMLAAPDSAGVPARVYTDEAVAPEPSTRQQFGRAEYHVARP
jgi:cytochrome c peroxidase